MIVRPFLLAATALALAMGPGAAANDPSEPLRTAGEVIVNLEELESIGYAVGHPDSTVEAHDRWVAAALAVFLGPFGAHRLYLGTTAKVPIVYGITFGGFYLLVLIDLGHLLFTRDLAPYRHNDRVFMWSKPRAPLTPP